MRHKTGPKDYPYEPPSSTRFPPLNIKLLRPNIAREELRHKTGPKDYPLGNETEVKRRLNLPPRILLE